MPSIYRGNSQSFNKKPVKATSVYQPNSGKAAKIYAVTPKRNGYISSSKPKDPEATRIYDDYNLGGAGGSGVGGGYGSVAADYEDWQKLTNDEVARRAGIDKSVYNYTDILARLNGVTNKKFDEFDTQTTRAGQDNLRALEGSYEQYLNNQRENRAAAVQSGIMKGAGIASQLATTFDNNKTIAENQQIYHDTLYDLAQQRATQIEQDNVSAQEQADKWAQWFGNIKGTYASNDVNKYAAELAARAQIQAASIGASGQITAANSVNNAAQWYLNRFIENAGGDYTKGLANYLDYTKSQSAVNWNNARK